MQWGENPNMTAMTILDFLQKGKYLVKGYHVYMDNYYNSPDLCQELLAKQTLVCSTQKSTRKGLPKAVTLK